MSDLRELYQQLIIDHGRKPRNFAANADANHIKEGFNPLCGDKITLFLTEKDGLITNISFLGTGCAISMASASLMTESLKGKSVAEAKELFKNFHELITRNITENAEKIGKLAVLSGVAEFPARVKCATLAWHTFIAAINDDEKIVSTETN